MDNIFVFYIKYRLYRTSLANGPSNKKIHIPSDITHMTGPFD